MFWSEKAIPILVCIWLAGCHSAEKAPDVKKTYFDIRGFFDMEISRLAKQNPVVTKTVTDGETSERKQVNISDWQSELGLFTESDINKPSWGDSYQVAEAGNTVTYEAKGADLRTRKISITKSEGGRVQHIRIENRTKNMLYTSAENLDYYPDSLYSIDKTQVIKILGTHHYTIAGNLK